MDALKFLWQSFLDILSSNVGADEDAETVDPEPDPEPDTDPDPEPDPEVDPDAETDPSKKTDRSTEFKENRKKAQEADKLVELGILVRGEDGTLHANPDAVQPKKSESSTTETEFSKLALSKDDVDKDSWGIADKINKRFDVANSNFSNLLDLMGNRIKIVMDFPEFITKDSPLRKKAMEIARNDKDFMKMIQSRTDFELQLVKRAKELLSGKTPSKPIKKKGKFIVGKGDAGAGGKPSGKKISELSGDELDKLEKDEHKRLFPGGKIK